MDNNEKNKEANKNKGAKQNKNSSQNKTANQNKPPNPNKTPRSRSKPRSGLPTDFSVMSITGMSGGNNFLKALECPVCLMPMTETILMCETGHSLCHKCSVKLTPPLCPTCGSKITLQRNYSLEEMAKTMALPCNNAKFGCKETTLPGQMAKHFEGCKFRQVFCPLGKFLGKCAWNGNMTNLTAHIKDKHAENNKYSLGKEIQLNNFSTSSAYSDVQIMTNEAVFLFHLNVNVYEKVAYFALQCIGDESAANKWKYTLHLYSKSCPLKKIEISDMCTSDSTDISDVFNDGLCVGVPLKILNNYIHKENQKLFLKLFTYYQKSGE